MKFLTDLIVLERAKDDQRSKINENVKQKYSLGHQSKEKGIDVRVLDNYIISLYQTVLIQIDTLNAFDTKRIPCHFRAQKGVLGRYYIQINLFHLH